MSAEMLRRAAVAIRRDQDIEENLGHIGEREFTTWFAVADWLDHMAEKAERNIRPDLYLSGWKHAVIVARAYLGEQP